MIKCEKETTAEGAKLLPSDVRRQLIIIRGRSGLIYEKPWVVQNQADFGRGEDDYVNMVTAHQNTNIGIDAKILGVHEEVRKRCVVMVDGKETEFVESTPKVRNIWIGKGVRLLTPEEAARTPYSGQTALSWATHRGETPEMVVQASNGYFYPATKDDIVMSSKS